MSSFDEVDRLLVEKWREVGEVVQARDALIAKVQALVQHTGASLRAWCRDRLGYELDTKASDGEYWLVKPAWRLSEKNPAACLVLGGLKAEDAFSGEKTYACVYSFSDKGNGFQRTAFRNFIRGRLGSESERWQVDTDKGCPLNQYLEPAQAVILAADELEKWVKDRLTWLADDLEEHVDGAVADTLKESAGSMRR